MVYLKDMEEGILKIEEYTDQITENEFYNNTQIHDAVLRRFEIIGEAAKHIPDDFRNDYSDIPWRQIAGIRDIVIHEYFGVNLKRVWRTLKYDIPDLKVKIIKIISDLENNTK